GIIEMAMSVYKCREDYRVPKINHRLTRFGDHVTSTTNLRNPLAPNSNHSVRDEIPLARPDRA
ncbi:MAG: hypothetical protein QGF29_01875, partial [Verrucomicrobiota bacterium]|nr:hypothetical protein [Verrucomicrobiota bacterium]